MESVNLVLAKYPDLVKDAAEQFVKDPVETHFKGVKTNSSPDKQNYMLKFLDGLATAEWTTENSNAVISTSSNMDTNPHQV